ncbi:MAG: hypothetical protein JXA51_03725 [Dehalococcoidales bacterium]|nr:hypothetical protein [Dehalococcoidales bacterium]
MDTSLQTFDISIFRYVPELIGWIIGIVLAVIMVQRGGTRLEKLLLAGCSLMFIAPLSGLLVNGWLTRARIEQGISYIEMMQSPLWIVFSIIIALLSLAGLVCLVWAFLAKFRGKKPEAA